MRHHDVEKPGFCLGVAESLQSIEMDTGNVHSVRASGDAGVCCSRHVAPISVEAQLEF
jgi:hypothetical protein